MALLFTDGCENDVLLSKWTSITGNVSYNSSAGVITNTGAIAFPPATVGTNQLSSNTLQKIVRNSSVGNRLDNANTTTRTSFWFKCTQAITTESIFLNWREYFYSDNAVLTIGTDGKLKISNWYPLTDTAKRVYYTTSMSRIDDNQWHAIELAMFYSGTSAGLLEVYVDNLLALRRTGANLGTGVTAPTLLTNFFIGGLNNGTMYIDDLIIWDDLSIPNNYTKRKGPTNLYTIRPSADTSFANSIPSSGSTRFNLINENKTSFANSVRIPARTMDVYDFSNMPEVNITGQVYGISASLVFASTTNGYPANLRMLLTSDGVNFTRSSNTFLQYSTNNVANGLIYTTAFINDTWSANVVNGFKFGYEALA